MSSFPSGFAPPPAAAPELEHYFAQIAAKVESAWVDIEATGDASFDSDVAIAGDLDVNGGVDIAGDLTLSGTTSTLTFSNLNTAQDFLNWSTNGQMTLITDQGGLGISCDSSMLLYVGDFSVPTVLGDLSIAAGTTTETIFLMADGAIALRTNRQTNFASTHLWSFNTDGTLDAPGTIDVAGNLNTTGNIGISGGTLTIQHASSTAALNLEAVDGQQRNINFRDETSGNLRWVVKVNTNEDFQILSRADDGSAIGTALEIDRATIAATLGGALSVTGDLSVSGALTATASGDVDINNNLVVGNRLTVENDGAQPTDLESTGFHEGFWIGRNLRYSGSGDPATNATYITTAGANNEGGLAYFIKANGGDTGWYFDWYSAPTSTGAGNAATLTQRMRLHHEGLLLQGATGEDQILQLNATADSDSGGYAALVLNGDTGNTTGEKGGAYVKFLLDNSASVAMVGFTQGAFWPDGTNPTTGVGANELVLACDNGIAIVQDTTIVAKFSSSEVDIHNVNLNLNSNSIIGVGSLGMSGAIDMNGNDITEVGSISTSAGSLVPIITQDETFDFGNVAAGSSLGHLFTFNGLETTDAIFLAYDGISAGERDLLFTITVSTTNSANLRVHNPTSSDINPGAITFRCVAFKL